MYFWMLEEIACVSPTADSHTWVMNKMCYLRIWSGLGLFSNITLFKVVVKHVQNLTSIISSLGTAVTKDLIKYVSKCFSKKEKCIFKRLGFSFPEMRDV